MKALKGLQGIISLGKKVINLFEPPHTCNLLIRVMTPNNTGTMYALWKCLKRILWPGGKQASTILSRPNFRQYTFPWLLTFSLLNYYSRTGMDFQISVTFPFLNCVLPFLILKVHWKKRPRSSHHAVHKVSWHRSSVRTTVYIKWIWLTFVYPTKWPRTACFVLLSWWHLHRSFPDLACSCEDSP